METTAFEVQLNDGRVFRVFCANSTQKKRFSWGIQKLGKYKPTVINITNGIHVIKQWEDIVESLT